MIRRACVGLGANLGDARTSLTQALDALDALPGTRVTGVSSLWRSAPVDATGPDYLNAVAVLETPMAALELLAAMQAIERAGGRVRSHRNAPRTLDLDLLLFDPHPAGCPSSPERVVDDTSLQVPHPRMHQRAFVLAPLAEVMPEADIPGRGPIAPLLAACAGQSLERIDDARGFGWRGAR